MKLIGPVRIIGSEVNTEVKVPLATFETPMWPSTNRGASVSRYTKGIQCTIIDERMTRSVLLEARSAADAYQVITTLKTQSHAIKQIIQNTSHHMQLIDWHHQIVGNLLYIRLEATTGEASGHNMVTKAADAFLQWVLQQYPELKYVSISGNYCVDKKVSAVNGILGRGKNVIAEIEIPREICLQRLKTTPEAIVNLHIKKNLLGSIIAGGLRTANAHFANLLLAFYLATGQDAANIVEGSQGFVHTELREDVLYFSVTVPNIIVGAIGNGKHLDFVRENLALLGCEQINESGGNARRLAIIAAATVLCGELSLLAAQTNPGELMRAHVDFERGSAVYREPSFNTKKSTV
jgi:hydroxymethylglutaryl-CoA reductase (NADPH)